MFLLMLLFLLTGGFPLGQAAMAAGMEDPLSALEGKWAPDPSVAGQEKYTSGEFINFDITGKRIFIGEAHQPDGDILAYEVMQIEPFVVLKTWPVDNPNDIDHFRFTVSGGKLFMAEHETPDRGLYLIRAGQ
jgi:hypothetical protein